MPDASSLMTPTSAAPSCLASFPNVASLTTSCVLIRVRPYFMLFVNLFTCSLHPVRCLVMHVLQAQNPCPCWSLQPHSRPDGEGRELHVLLLRSVNSPPRWLRAVMLRWRWARAVPQEAAGEAPNRLLSAQEFQQSQPLQSLKRVSRIIPA